MPHDMPRGEGEVSAVHGVGARYGKFFLCNVYRRCREVFAMQCDARRHILFGDFMNYFEQYDWDTILKMYPPRNYDVSEYHKILSPEFPEFLKKYLSLPILQRLSGIGLLCGTDWTPLYKNRFYYSRLDHSVGVALIVWHFTKDKAQTIAGLLHDVSTPVFSHVSDFRKGDALTQTATEEDNSSLVCQDKKLAELLKTDGLTVNQVKDYHVYPIADNEIPQLSADRLEYMFPSGMALEGSWTLDKIKETYADISVLKNEQNIDELGFNSVSIAENYCRLFCMTGHILQLQEDKVCLQLLGEIMNRAVELKILSENDFMTLSEKQILEKIENAQKTFKSKPANDGPASEYFFRLYKTFRTMTKIEHTQNALPPEDYFSVNLKVKMRYINPLVKTENGIFRLSEVSDFARKIISDFQTYTDTPFGCVKLVALN